MVHQGNPFQPAKDPSLSTVESWFQSQSVLRTPSAAGVPAKILMIHASLNLKLWGCLTRFSLVGPPVYEIYFSSFGSVLLSVTFINQFDFIEGGDVVYFLMLLLVCIDIYSCYDLLQTIQDILC